MKTEAVVLSGGPSGVSGGGWWGTALGLARDAIPVATIATQCSFGAAKRGAAAAAGISGAIISGGGQVAAAGAAALGATGVVSVPVASRVGAGLKVGTAAAGLSVRSAHFSGGGGGAARASSMMRFRSRFDM